MLSLDHAHPFHSLTELSKSSVGIHNRPAINKSYRDQLEVLWNSKPGGGGNKTVTREEQEKRVGNNSVCVCVCLHVFASIAMCVRDAHMRSFDCVWSSKPQLTQKDNLLSAVTVDSAVLGDTSRATTTFMKHTIRLSGVLNRGVFFRSERPPRRGFHPPVASSANAGEHIEKAWRKTQIYLLSS